MNKIRGTVIGTPIKPEKSLIKAKDLTDEQKAQARVNIGAADASVIGNIETALDGIIAIQNELMGGDGV